MKHNFKHFACLLVAVLCFGQVWGAVYFEDTFSNVGNASSGSVLPRDGWTAGSGTAAPQGNSGVRLGASSSGASIVKSAMTSIEGTKSLKVTIYVARYNTNANTLTVTATNGTISALADGSVGTLSDGTLTISPSANAGVTSTTAAATWTNDFKTEFTITGASSTTTITFSSNKRVILGPVKIEDADGTPAPAKTLTSVAVSGTPTKTSYHAGDNFDPTGLTVTGTYSDASSAAITSGITWSYDPSQELALNQTSIDVIATVSEIASPKFTVTGLTVIEAPATVNYEKVTAEPAEWSGEYILVYEDDATNARVWKGADQANNYAEAKITAGVIAAPEGAAELTIAKVANSTPVVYTIKVGDKYIGQTSNSNGIKIQDAAINNSISYNGTDAAVDIIASEAHLRYNSASSSYFRYYKSSSYSSQKKIQLYKKVDGAVKPEAGLAYAEADQKKLTKLGDAFTAPTLSNPNNLSGITYASNNTTVAEVAANGAVTIKAAGVAVITASFAGNDDYKAGSASYTIGVTSHAGTEADPYVAADAKIAIDVMETVENAYATGIVSKVVTVTLPNDGYITFDFSADGATTGQQIEAYKCFGLNSAKFTAVTDIETGATVVITGSLKKYNSTYEFDQNCHLVSYEAPAVPKTSIANTKETAYTVAQALVYAADGVTYDLDDYVYVQGVVYDVKSFNSTNGTLDIYIKDANAENQFELFKCAGINDGNATTPFEALTDVQAGNIVIGYGQLTVYNTTYEFKQGNYLVDLQKPVTGIELDATAEVEAGSTVNLTATILPSNATGTIVWTVESGSDKASVADGVVTGVAEGSATIRASVQGTEIYAECTVTVTAASAPVTYDYALVTAASQLQDGLKVIIVAAEEDKAAGSAAATYRNVVDVERTTDGNYLILDSENMPTEFTIGVSGDNFTFNDGDGYMYESAVKSVKVREEAFEWTISIGDGNIATIGAPNGDLKYNSGSPRFTTYASGQQALQLYVKNDGKQAAGLAWSTDAVELTVGDAFTAPTLTNPNGLTVTIESNNTELATVEGGVVSLVADATGTVTITASFAGNDTYRATSVSYTITVSATTPAPVGTENVVIIAEYNSKFYALTNSINNKTAAAVVIEKDGDNIIVPSADAKTAIQWTKTTSGENTTFQDADGKYLKGVSNGGDLTIVDDVCNWSYNSQDKYYYIGSRSFIYRESANGFKNYATSNAGSSDYSAIAEVRVIAADNIVVTSKADPQLAYSPSSVELTVGGTFTPATLTYASGFDGLAAVTYESSNTNLATVEGGVVSLVADATGTATITASFAGNETYNAGSATYTITVKEASAPLSLWASVYTSNITLSTASGTSASAAKVVYNSTQYEALKAGTGSVQGAVVVTVPDGATTLHFHAYGWKGETVTLTVEAPAGVTVTPSEEISINSDDGVTSNSPFTLSTGADPKSDAYFAVALSGNSGDVALRIKATNGKRFVIFGVNQEGAATPASIVADPTSLVFGSVEQDAEVEAKTINVTLTEVAAATVALSGDGASAFSIDKAALSESGTITVTPNTTTVGSYAATITISDNASEADPVEVAVSMTVREPEVPDVCDETDDFLNTVDKTSPTGYNDRSTPNGWSAVYAGYKVIDEKAYWMINGKTTTVGVITSPELSNGIATLKFRYANTNSESNGVSVKIEIKQNGGVVKEYTLTKPNSEVVQNTVYTETIEDINVEGTFQIVFTNLSPSNNTGNKDRVSIGRICWTNYNGSGDSQPQDLVYTEVRSGLEIGRHYTACLKKEIVAVKGATIWGLRYRNEAGTIAYLEQAQLPLAAGTPFIYQATDAIFEASYEGADAEQPTESGALRGTFEDMDAEALAGVDGTIYMMYQNALRPLGTNNHLDAYRAYLLFNEMEVPGETPQDTPGRHVRSMSMQGNVATGIEDTESAAQAVKVMIDGQLFIQRGDKLYDVTGQMVK